MCKEAETDKRNIEVAGQNERVVMRFLEIKARLQGAEFANRTKIEAMGDDMYDLTLPCKDGEIHCGIVSKLTLSRMTIDMVNMLGV